MVNRVARELHQHPRRELLYQFLRDHSQMRRPEIEKLFEFIYSYLVNAFKGEVAELMSRVVIRAFVTERAKAGDLPVDAIVIAGPALTSFRTVGGKLERSWQKSADALIGVTRSPMTEGWAFHGVVEIKSYRESLRKMFDQIDQHVNRVKLGLRIGAQVVDPSLSGFVDRSDGGAWSALSSPRRPGRILKLAIRPSPGSRDPQDLRRWGTPDCWVDELPCTTSHLHEAAYQLSAWYIAQAGPDVFLPSGATAEQADVRIANPWPGLSPESAAGNMLKLALHETSLRESIDTGFESGRPRKRSDLVFARLYNSVCYGSSFARSDRLLTPEDYRAEWDAAAVKDGVSVPAVASPPDAVDEALAAAHSLFSSSRLDEARASLERIPMEGLNARQLWRHRWLLGMVAFRRGSVPEARTHFPGPSESDDRYWWTRNAVMLARLRARAGDPSGAREALRSITSDDFARFRGLQVEARAVSALGAALDGHESRSSELLEAAAALASLREEFRRRETESKGKPIDVNVSSVVHGVIDLAAARAVASQPAAALDLLSQLEGLDEWMVLFIEHDPLMAGVTEDARFREPFAAWRERAAKGIESFWKNPREDPAT